ncbi:DUF7224 domain-containing protein [Microbacterium radiodurans]|uniref:DUF7224 domain-containing protein n=1 Tax=Microbacterium radiodurans TaxID=661398 RepID=A0A5J5IQK7_9MICO|nr:hypothetical protein [Microbacterium radiodurans]KAA9085428.1 hypothetical protein F6B42_13275 [Microbacterium radiodurans]
MWIVAQFSPPIGVPPQTWTWVIGHSVLLVLVPAAVSATGAALEAARLRTRRQENAVNVRSSASIVWNAIWPSYLCGLVAQLIAIGIVALSTTGGAGRIPWGMLGAIGAMLLFHTTLGFFMGSLVRPIFGVPAALAMSYIWLGFTGTVPYFELRHLAGLVLETCCYYDQQPRPASLASVTVFSILAAIGLVLPASAALRIVAGRTVLAASVGAALVVGAFGAGLVVANGLPPSAAEPRDRGELVCTDGEVTVCLFPEQQDPVVVARTQEMVTRVRDQGVMIPARVEASSGAEYDRDRIRLRAFAGMSDQQLAGSLASDLPETICDGDPVEVAIERDLARSTAVVWMQATMLGVDLSEVPLNGAEPGLTARVGALGAESEASRVAWVNEAIASLRDCATTPPGLP